MLIIKRIVANFVILLFYVEGTRFLFSSDIQNPYFPKDKPVPHNDVFFFVNIIKIWKYFFPNDGLIYILKFFSHHKTVANVELNLSFISEIRAPLNHDDR